MKKYRIIIILLLLFFNFISVGCLKNDDSLDQTDLKILGKEQIYVYETTKLNINNEHIYKEIIWESLTSLTVSVDNLGNLKGLAPGVGIIKASLKNDENVFAFHEVTVLYQEEEIHDNDFLVVFDDMGCKFQNYKVDATVGLSSTFDKESIIVGPGISGFFNLILRNKSNKKVDVNIYFEETYNINDFSFSYSFDQLTWHENVDDLIKSFIMTEYDDERIVTVYWRWNGTNDNNSHYNGNLPFIICKINFEKK